NHVRSVTESVAYVFTLNVHLTNKFLFGFEKPFINRVGCLLTAVEESAHCVFLEKVDQSKHMGYFDELYYFYNLASQTKSHPVRNLSTIEHMGMVWKYSVIKKLDLDGYVANFSSVVADNNKALRDLNPVIDSCEQIIRLRAELEKLQSETTGLTSSTS
ncbi:MAG: hypothetical protein AAB656_03195, partial [Patescibacteria group bacterium]